MVIIGIGIAGIIVMSVNSILKFQFFLVFSPIFMTYLFIHILAYLEFLCWQLSVKFLVFRKGLALCTLSLAGVSLIFSNIVSKLVCLQLSFTTSHVVEVQMLLDGFLQVFFLLLELLIWFCIVVVGAKKQNNLNSNSHDFISATF